MRFLLILSLFLCSTAFALQDPVADAMIDIKTHRTGAYARAEAAYVKSKDNQEAGRLATILAFAPADEVKTPPYAYASFAFEHDQGLSPELRLKMAKLALEGSFSHSQFARAEQIAQEALDKLKLDESAEEYFRYQMAWCELNLNQPAKAYAILQSWLTHCKTCALRSEIATDLGKAYFESPNPPFPKITKADHKNFIDGLINGFTRAKKYPLSEFTQKFRKTDLAQAWMEDLFEHPQLKEFDSCLKLSVLEPSDSALWPEKNVSEALKACVRSSKKVSPQLLSLAEKLNHPDGDDRLLLSGLYENSGKADTACDVRLQAATTDFKIDKKTYLEALVSICKKAAPSEARAKSVVGLLSVPSLQSELAKQKNLMAGFLGEIEARPDWHQAFVNVDPKIWTARTSPETLENILLDPKWALEFRKHVWLEAQPAVAMNPDVLHALSEEMASDPKALQEFVAEIQKRPEHPEALTALLASRIEVSQDIFQKLNDENVWLKLSSEDRHEVYDRLLNKGYWPKISENWAAWSPRVQNDSVLLFATVGYLAKNPNANPPKAYDKIAQTLQFLRDPSQAQALDQLPKSPLKEDLLTVASTHQAMGELDHLNLAGGQQDVLPVLDSGLKVSTKAMRDLRHKKWSIAELATMNRGILKDGLGRFEQKIEGAGDDYKKIALLVKGWGKRL